MTRTEFDVQIAALRLCVRAQLAELEASDWEWLLPEFREGMERIRETYRDLLVRLTREVIEAELDAVAYAGRALMPGETAALLSLH